MKGDYRRFKRTGKEKQKQKQKTACAFNKVSQEPMFDTKPTQAPPPYLHIMVGVVLKKRKNTMTY